MLSALAASPGSGGARRRAEPPPEARSRCPPPRRVPLCPSPPLPSPGRWGTSRPQPRSSPSQDCSCPAPSCFSFFFFFFFSFLFLLLFSPTPTPSPPPPQRGWWEGRLFIPRPYSRLLPYHLPQVILSPSPPLSILISFLLVPSDTSREVTAEPPLRSPGFPRTLPCSLPEATKVHISLSFASHSCPSSSHRRSSLLAAQGF